MALRYAVLVTDKWFREQKAKLREVLGTKLRKDVDWWGFHFPDKVIPWFQNFEADFLDLVSQDKARESIQTRVKGAKDYVEAITEKLNNLTNLTRNVDFHNAESFLKWYAAIECHEFLVEKLTTVGDLFKWSYYIDESIVNRLVQKTLRVATPEELAELTEENDVYGKKYVFLARIGFKQSALRALKRNKLDVFDPNKWVDRMYEMLEANYSEKALQEGHGLSEFDLHGMKIVIDDRTVDAIDTRSYIKFLDEAYEAMVRKGFKSAWYGTVFIRCKECGGVNRLTGGGVGGVFHIGPDTVGVYSRPSGFIVELMAHELGHRYWFKQMSRAQRAKFESLVKVYKPLKVAPIPQNKVENAITVVHRWAEKVNSVLSVFQFNFRQGILRQATPEEQQKLIDKFADDIHEVVVNKADKDLDVYDAMNRVLSNYEAKEVDPELTKLMEAYTGTEQSAEVQLRRFCIREVVRKFFKDRADNIPNAIQEFVENALSMLQRVEDAAIAYIRAAQKALTREFAEGDVRPVLPVSEYGRSNIDEAWAEVFMSYVLDQDMTRDQVDSFKSVLKLGHLPGSSSNVSQSQA